MIKLLWSVQKSRDSNLHFYSHLICLHDSASSHDVSLIKKGRARFSTILHVENGPDTKMLHSHLQSRKCCGESIKLVMNKNIWLVGNYIFVAVCCKEKVIETFLQNVKKSHSLLDSVDKQTHTCLFEMRRQRQPCYVSRNNKFCRLLAPFCGEWMV